MKKANLVKVILVSTTVLLAGCQSMQNWFGDYNQPSYDNNHHYNQSAQAQSKRAQHPSEERKTKSQTKAKVESRKTRSATTTSTTVSTPHSAATTSTTTTNMDSPTVPTMSPSVGQ